MAAIVAPPLHHDRIAYQGNAVFVCRTEQVQTGEGQLGDTRLQVLEKSIKPLLVADMERTGGGPGRNFH